MLGASEARHPSCHGYIPPENRKIGLRRTSNTGDFFGLGDSSHKITWAAWHLLMFRFLFLLLVFFFFGSFFVGGCKFGLRAPRLNLYWREVTVLPAGKHFAYQVASMPINLRSTVANVSTARPTISQRTCGFGTCLPKILGCLINMII